MEESIITKFKSRLKGVHYCIMHAPKIENKFHGIDN